MKIPEHSWGEHLSFAVNSVQLHFLKPVLCRFEEDLTLARDIGSNAFRFSIEWSKIEPRRGEIDGASIARYHQIIKCIKK